MSQGMVDVTIKGKTPLLMNRFPLEPVEAIEKKPPEVQAEIKAYRTPKGELYVPGINLQRALIAGATYSKGKGRASLQKQAAACLMVQPEWMILYDPTTEIALDHYEIDVRSAVNPSTGGRILRYRPRLNEWLLKFQIEFDDVLINETQLRRIVDDTGDRVGLCDFRPACKGSFGRFFVTKWELV